MPRSRAIPPKFPRRERGVILFVALILLFILSLIGVTVARMQTVEERMAQNEDNREVGSEAAEAALRNAETNLLAGNYATFTADAGGLYELSEELAGTGTSIAATIDWSVGGTGIAYNGPALASIPANAQVPQYVIESLPPVAIPGQNLGGNGYGASSPPVAVYRVTAHGSGADATSQSIFQSIVR